MIYDEELMLFDAKALTTAEATNGTAIDFGVADPNIGEGNRINVHAEVVEAFTSEGAGTLELKIEHSDDDDTYTTLIATPATFAKGTLVDGYKIFDNVALPNTVKRYVRATATVGTADMTAGKITVGLNIDGV